MPKYESFAANGMKITGGETLTFFVVVPGHLREEYISWFNGQYYDLVAEGTMLRYGNLDTMPDNSTYFPDIVKGSPQGFIPDDERESYYSTAGWSPPPFSYG